MDNLTIWNLWNIIWIKHRNSRVVKNLSKWILYNNIYWMERKKKCKVEFNQPSCWLYSVTNLLVIQHLETLYLGGNHVRVVCERVWRTAQVCAKKQGLSVGSRGWLATASLQNDAHVPSVPEAKVLRQLLHYRTKVLGWPGHLLAAWTRNST